MTKQIFPLIQELDFLITHHVIVVEQVVIHTQRHRTHLLHRDFQIEFILTPVTARVTRVPSFPLQVKLIQCQHHRVQIKKIIRSQLVPFLSP